MLDSIASTVKILLRLFTYSLGDSKMLSEAISPMLSTLMLCGVLGALGMVLGKTVLRDQK